MKTLEIKELFERWLLNQKGYSELPKEKLFALNELEIYDSDIVQGLYAAFYAGIKQ